MAGAAGVGLLLEDAGDVLVAGQASSVVGGKTPGSCLRRHRAVAIAAVAVQCPFACKLDSLLGFVWRTCLSVGAVGLRRRVVGMLVGMMVGVMVRWDPEGAPAPRMAVDADAGVGSGVPGQLERPPCDAALSGDLSEPACKKRLMLPHTGDGLRPELVQVSFSVHRAGTSLSLDLSVDALPANDA